MSLQLHPNLENLRLVNLFVQPLNVYEFRTWKNYVRHFSDSVILLDYDLNLHIRNNIIKLQSLVHNQLSSPSYHSLFKYSWFKSGYIAEKPGEFVQFYFIIACNIYVFNIFQLEFTPFWSLSRIIVTSFGVVNPRKIF